MTGLRRMGVMVMAGGMLLPVSACSRTSDGTIVMDRPVAISPLRVPNVEPFIPRWLRPRPEPVPVASNFPPPPVKRSSAPRRKARPPVVTTSTGSLACKDVSEGGRVRMVCE